MSTSIDTEKINKQFHVVIVGFQKHMTLLFFLVLTSLYGFLIWRINVLSSAPPSQADLVTATGKVSKPQISAKTVLKLQGLEDNSKRVQAIFNEARQNPFQE